jgi:hypothetical protein
MPGDVDNEILKLKQGAIHAWVSDVLTTVIWKEKQGL